MNALNTSRRSDSSESLLICALHCEIESSATLSFRSIAPFYRPFLVCCGIEFSMAIRAGRNELLIYRLRFDAMRPIRSRVEKPNSQMTEKVNR